MDLKAFIRDIPDFPKPGIVFKDITPLLADAAALQYSIEHLMLPFKKAGIEKVIGIESRGFIFATGVALALGAGFIPVRKPKKLPYKTQRIEYDLEYGKDALEIHHDAIRDGARVLIVDDLLATGGTAAATCELVKQLGGNLVGMAFVIELAFLNGRTRFKHDKIISLIQY